MRERPQVPRPLIGWRECCVYVPPTRVENIGFWLVDDMSSVGPTKWWVFEKRRKPTSDCQVVFIGGSPTKYDVFLLVIDLFKRSCCFILTPHYYDSFMMWPTGCASTMLVPPTPSFEQFLNINFIIFTQISEWRNYICISEISRIYKVNYSLIHPFPPRKRVKWNKRNTEQQFEGPNYSLSTLFFEIKNNCPFSPVLNHSNQISQAGYLRTRL